MTLEKKSDILFKLIMNYLPHMRIEEGNASIFLNNGSSLFKYNLISKDIYVKLNFIDDLFKLSGFEFLDMEFAQHPNLSRKNFDDLIKFFAKQHYGWDVNAVWFYWD